MNNATPPSGALVWWRPKGALEWRFGYTSFPGAAGLVRLGRFNGDTSGGSVVSISEVEWKHY